MVEVEEFKRDDSLDYLKVLRALMELPFSVGRNLLVDFLKGSYKNSSIIKNKLDELTSFSSMENWSRDDILELLDVFIQKKMVEQVALDGNSFAKVLKITLKGRNELSRPTMDKPPEPVMETKDTIISEWDKKVFSEYEQFLEGLNDEQKKAVVSPSKSILTIAGAGSGKTSVLVKRIAFLVLHRGVDPSEILAITFTRKARQEMETRLNALGIRGVQVSTFNSFSEKILRAHGKDLYGRSMRVLSYADKHLALNLALYQFGYELDQVIEKYFSSSMKRMKTKNQLHNIFLNDCYALIDYFTITNTSLYDFSNRVEPEHRNNAKMVYDFVKYMIDHKESQGLRSFSDQLTDVVRAFKKRPAIIPYFEHVLVDEYQDVNSVQVDILNLINHDNLFAVGDPRQAIYGWRGSDMKFILDFEEHFPDTEVIHLVKNYRSSQKVVDLMNSSILHMKLPNLLHHHDYDDESDLKLFSFSTEEAEREFVMQVIVPTLEKGETAFVLARTNRQVNDLSAILKQRGINHIVKTDDSYGNGGAKKDETLDEATAKLTLATVHAIKGLEADTVFLIGANKDSFPCKASDHPVLEFIKDERYDKFEEEKRLFYVAISRARKNLYITHSSSQTDFITKDMEEMF